MKIATDHSYWPFRICHHSNLYIWIVVLLRRRVTIFTLSSFVFFRKRNDRSTNWSSSGGMLRGNSVTKIVSCEAWRYSGVKAQHAYTTVPVSYLASRVLPLPTFFINRALGGDVKEQLFKLISSSQYTLHTLQLPIEVDTDGKYSFWKMKFPQLSHLEVSEWTLWPDGITTIPGSDYSLMGFLLSHPNLVISTKGNKSVFKSAKFTNTQKKLELVELCVTPYRLKNIVIKYPPTVDYSDQFERSKWISSLVTTIQNPSRKSYSK